MKKMSKILLSLILGIFAVSITFGLIPTNTEAPQIPANASLSTTTQNSSIFKEITNDGLASYLEISLVSVNGTITDLKITQTIGSNTSIIAEDETKTGGLPGTRCYYNNEPIPSSAKKTFYFTRAAIYSVHYKVNGKTYSESCTFTPQINSSVLTNCYTYNIQDQKEVNKNYVTKINNSYYILNAGFINLLEDNNSSYRLHSTLYTCSAKVGQNLNSDLIESIPENSFGTMTIVLKSNNGHTTLTQNIVVITNNFKLNFKDELDNDLINEEYSYLDNYVFNQSVEVAISVDPTAKNLLGQALNNREKFDLFNTLDFFVVETERTDSNNGNYNINTPISLNSPISTDGYTTAPTIKFTLDAVDHSVFTITTKIKNSTYSYNNTIEKIKVVTKVPYDTPTSTNNVFKISLGQVTTNDYLSGVLGGYLPNGSVVYVPANGITISNKLSINLLYSYKHVGSSQSAFSTLTSGATKQFDLSYNGATITIKNNTASFDQFFVFSFTIKSYTGTDSSFIKKMLEPTEIPGSNTIYKLLYKATAGSSYSHVEDNFSDDNYNYTIINPIYELVYRTVDDYSTTCIPMHIRVTHNGTTFEDIYTITDSDQIRFSEYGSYVIEFYNIPSYEFLINNKDSLTLSNYYYKLSFNILGPSISATTTDSAGKPLTISNHLYTQNDVSFNVSLGANQTAIVYKNGTEIARSNENWESSITKKSSGCGTWKISIVDSQNNEIKSLSFTLADSIYQGFSINNRAEYESLTVSTQVSSMPVIYESLEESSAYHLTQAGKYKIDISAKEEFKFSVSNGGTTTSRSTYTANSNSIILEVVKSYFALTYTEGRNGSRINSEISISSLAGVQLQSMEVYKNGKLIKTYTASQLENWQGSAGLESFSENGTYTFKLTDKFGNTFESKIEKYYKVNAALVVLILLAIVGFVVMIVTIIKARHKVSVK